MDRPLVPPENSPSLGDLPQGGVALNGEESAEIRNLDLLRSVVELTTDAIFVKDLQGKYLFFNRAASDFVGRPIEAVLGHDDSELFSPDSVQLIRRRDQLVIESGKPLIAEERLTADGTERTYLASKVPFRDSFGNVVGLIGISRDISDRKRIEEEHLQNQAFTDAIIQTVAEGICVFDQLSPLHEKTFVVWNDRMLELTGYTLEEINEQGWSTVLKIDESGDPGSLVPFLELSPVTIHRNVEGRIRCKDGSIRTLSASTSRIKQGFSPTTFVATLQDITEKKSIEQMYWQNEQRFRLFLEYFPGAAWIKNDKLQYTFVNPTGLKLLGMDASQVLGKTAHDIYDPETAARFQENDLRVLRENQGIGFIDVLRDGIACTSHVCKFPIPSGRGEPPLIVGFAVDITEQLKSQANFRQSEERLRVAQALAHIGSFYLDIVTNQVTWSDELFRIYGYEPQSIQPTLEIYLSHIHSDDLPQVRAAIEKSLAEKGDFQHEYRILTLYQDVRWISATGRCLCDDRNEVIAIEGTCQDISERKNLEEQLLHSQKMEAIGLLAGGVAHDFNNLLTVVTGYTYMLLSQTDSGHPAYQSLQAIQDAANRAALLTRQLLTFSRRQRLVPVVLDLNDVISNVTLLLQRMVGETVQIQIDLAEKMGMVKIDPTQAEQILLNLAINARDAMPHGGELRIMTRKVEEVTIVPSSEGPSQQVSDFIDLYVCDNGTGMSERVRSRIFEPFFTTKDVGKGTGLGLAVVHGIVQQSGGEIQVQSEVGQGTVFRIRFPMFKEFDEGLETLANESRSNSKTILLVDDDEAVRRVTKVTLEGQGYCVLEADTAVAALQLMEEAVDPIHLLVTDVAMPEIGGRELAVLALQKNKQLRILFISGYSNSAALQDGLSVPNDFLEKPFTPHGLAAKVESLLNFVEDQRKAGY